MKKKKISLLVFAEKKSQFFIRKKVFHNKFKK